MSLSNKERRKLTTQHTKTYFPSAAPPQITQIVDICVRGFDGDYSPIKIEQDHRTATGTGIRFEDFVIYVGRNVTHQEPIGVDDTRLGEILRGVSM